MVLQLDASALAARLDRAALIDALDAAFRGSAVVPARRQYADIAGNYRRVSRAESSMHYPCSSGRAR